MWGWCFLLAIEGTEGKSWGQFKVSRSKGKETIVASDTLPQKVKPSVKHSDHGQTRHKQNLDGVALLITADRSCVCSSWCCWGAHYMSALYLDFCIFRYFGEGAKVEYISLDYVFIVLVNSMITPVCAL